MTFIKGRGLILTDCSSFVSPLNNWTETVDSRSEREKKERREREKRRENEGEKERERERNGKREWTNSLFLSIYVHK
jgi:hypothetical protein